MSNETVLTYEEVRNTLKVWINENGKSMSYVADAVGLSSSAISQYINGKYVSPHKITPKIIDFLSTDHKKVQAPKRPDFQLTHVSKTILELIEYTHIQANMGVGYGDAGVGKTMAARAYCEDHSDAAMITITPVFANIKGVSELLCEELHVTDKRTNMAAYLGITRKLKKSGMVIIVDEAQHLTVKTLEHLRSMIVDDAGCGLVLLGNQLIYNRMTGKQESQLAQLFSRIGIRKNVLTSLTRKDDIDLLFPSLGSDEKDFLYRVAHDSKWGIRGAVNVFLGAAGNGDMSKNGLAAMAKYMGIGFS